MGYMPLVWYFAVLGVNTPFKFAVFVCEWAAPLPGIKGDKDLDRPWGQISQNKSENDKKEKIVQRSQLCDHLVGRRDTMNAESNERFLLVRSICSPSRRQQLILILV